MNYKDHLIEEVMKMMLEGYSPAGSVGRPVGASASANGHYIPDDQKFKGVDPEEDEALKEAKEFDINTAWQSIPTPELSELGWADPSKSKDGKLSNASRSEVSNYLSSQALKANTLEGQLKNLQKILEEAGKKEMSVSETLSFLVFYKTLTYIISDFNPATAGFLFESLLGVLSGGHQIAAKGAGGGDTIADFVYKRGQKSKGGAQYVSLKLLTEGKTGIGGSFRDLIKDMKAKGTMQYIVVLKELSGDKTDVEGRLYFYEFDFDASTFLDLLKGKKELTLVDRNSRAFIDGEFDPTVSKSKWNEWIGSEQVIQGILATIESQKDSLGQIKKGAKRGDLWDAIQKDITDNGAEDRDFVDIIKNNSLMHDSEEDKLTGIVVQNTYDYLRSVWADQVKGSHSEESLKRDRVSQLGNKFLKKGTKKSPKDNYTKAKEFNWMTPADSYSELEKLASSKNPKQLWETLQRYSLGYLEEGQFEITQAEMKHKTGDPFAVLTVGRSIVAEALNKMVNDVNEKMFKIYSQLSNLSGHLREFFMKDLDTEQGSMAKQSASSVARDTNALVKTSSKK